AKLKDAGDGDLAEVDHTHLRYLRLAIEVTIRCIDITEMVANWIGDVEEEAYQAHCGTDHYRTIARLLKSLRDTGREVDRGASLRQPGSEARILTMQAK
ncbi:hypothetical protein BGZ82_011414, partial [Podila clonocystis]